MQPWKYLRPRGPGKCAAVGWKFTGSKPHVAAPLHSRQLRTKPYKSRPLPTTIFSSMEAQSLVPFRHSQCRCVRFWESEEARIAVEWRSQEAPAFRVWRKWGSGRAQRSRRPSAARRSSRRCLVARFATMTTAWSAAWTARIKLARHRAGYAWRNSARRLTPSVTPLMCTVTGLMSVSASMEARRRET